MRLSAGFFVLCYGPVSFQAVKVIASVLSFLGCKRCLCMLYSTGALYICSGDARDSDGVRGRESVSERKRYIYIY